MAIQEYFQEQAKIEQEYGPRTILLTQDGAFYEVYGIDTPELKLGYANEVSRILNMKLTRKKGMKEPHSINNPQMVGFPDYALNNHVSKLLRPPSGEPGFVVVVYNQIPGEKKDKGGKVRKFTELYGPSSITNDDFESNILNKYVMCVMINNYKCHIEKQYINYMDLAIINLLTGDVYLYELYNTFSDNNKINTDLYRIFNSYNIVEVLIIGDKTPILPGQGTARITKIAINKEYSKHEYQELFLKELYSPDVNLGLRMDQDPSLNLDFDFTKGREFIAPFIYLVNHIYKYNPTIKTILKYPTILEESNNLILNNDSITQLYLFPTLGGKYNLFHIINHTKTCMGERLLRHRLSQPFIDPEIINKYYDKIELVRDIDIKKYQLELKNIIDIDKKYRKWVLTCSGHKQKLQPQELENMYTSLIKINEILSFKDYPLDLNSNLINNFTLFIKKLEKVFDFQVLRTWKGHSNYFKIDIPELDETIGDVNTALETLEYINKQFSLLTGSSKLEKTEKEGYYISITKSKYKASGNLANFNIPISCPQGTIKQTTITHDNVTRIILSNSVKIHSHTIKILSNIINDSELKIIDILDKQFLQILNDLLPETDIISKISSIIAELDVSISNAYTSLKYGYCKPEIIDEKNGDSFIISTDLRNPVVEYYSDKEYISNDIELNDNSLLLYGLNLAGKSTFLRSVGLSIIMAQAGMFVPASSFIYYPYNRLISKITIKDEPEHNKSTYMVEVDEFKDICARSNQNTLVILDESGSSTELYSGTALVASLINFLSEKRTSFIVSTHLNELQDIDIIKNNNKIHIKHFNVTVSNGKIDLNRKIMDGGMNKIYGLEIAGALGLQEELLTSAFKIRGELLGESDEILSTKKSRYNSKLYVDHCCYCGSKKDLHTHHVRHQADANEYGLINGVFHKNKKFNLEIVCKECHEKIHHT